MAENASTLNPTPDGLSTPPKEGTHALYTVYEGRQNDVKALINLEDPRKELVSPLLNMRGMERHLNDFLAGWGDHPYLMDISRSPLDIASDVIGERDLHNPKNHFENKRNWFAEVKAKNNSLIPVVSWLDTDNARDIIQLARLLLTDFNIIAVRVVCPPEIVGQAGTGP
ncbi:hypothetical protein [Pseudomonas lini]|uniref:hypothetical protein n=1 Tax=Pseudomonas lini TaxID=163011 RepID=UPI00345E3ADF